MSTLSVPNPAIFPEAPSVGGPVPSFAQKKIQLGKRDVLACFRALVLLVLAVLFFFNDRGFGQAGVDPKAFGLMTLYLASIFGMFLIKPGWFEKEVVLPGFFLLDTVFITAGIYLTGV
ncbi:MAG TPA: hypothetical protein VFR02_09035, partial [bacterium]|nr:hypothetical protein [bacterium]